MQPTRIWNEKVTEADILVVTTTSLHISPLPFPLLHTVVHTNLGITLGPPPPRLSLTSHFLVRLPLAWYWNLESCIYKPDSVQTSYYYMFIRYVPLGAVNELMIREIFNIPDFPPWLSPGPGKSAGRNAYAKLKMLLIVTTVRIFVANYA